MATGQYTIPGAVTGGLGVGTSTPSAMTGGLGVSQPYTPPTGNQQSFTSQYPVLGSIMDSVTFWDNPLPTTAGTDDAAFWDAIAGQMTPTLTSIDAQRQMLSSLLGLNNLYGQNQLGLAHEGYGNVAANAAANRGFHGRELDLALQALGLDRQGIGLQRQGLGLDLADIGLREKGVGHDKALLRLRGREAQRLALSDATSRGAVVGPGYRDQRSFLARELAHQLAQKNLDLGRLGVERGRVGLAGRGLNLDEQGLGIKEGQARLGYDRGIEGENFRQRQAATQRDSDVNRIEHGLAVGGLEHIMGVTGLNADAAAAVQQAIEAAAAAGIDLSTMPPEVQALFRALGYTGSTGGISTQGQQNLASGRMS